MEKKYIKAFIQKATDGGTGYSFIASTNDVDRQGDIIDQKGWDLSEYQKNPVMLWAHDYDAPPVARALSLDPADPRGLFGTCEFAPEAANPFGPQLKALVDGGFVSALSVGFMPMERNGNTITKSQLLEISFVPVPANQNALMLMGKSLKSKGFAEAVIKSFLDNFTEKGVVPSNPNDKIMDADASWSAPTLGDFTDEEWDALSDSQKTAIAEHYAWAAEMPPATFDDLKLPHHDPKTGAANFKGVASAMGALNGARGGVSIPDNDKEKVYDHLAAHYKEFDETPPAMKAFSSEEKGAVSDELDAEQMQEQKWCYMDQLFDIIGAFCDVYLDDQTPVESWSPLLTEVAGLISALAEAGVPDEEQDAIVMSAYTKLLKKSVSKEARDILVQKISARLDTVLKGSLVKETSIEGGEETVDEPVETVEEEKGVDAVRTLLVVRGMLRENVAKDTGALFTINTFLAGKKS